MKITALVENVSSDGLVAEHGLSLFIESNGKKILFDMGQTDLFEKNAALLGIDLSEADIAVLSHGHYDHGGGLKPFLEINKKAHVYINQYAFEPHYNGMEKYIGLDTSLQNNERFIITGETTIIDENMTLYSCNEREKKFDLGSFGLNMKINGKMLPDDFRHEQYLIIEENGKRVLFSGCSHKSVLDIETRFRPDVFIGGFHFSKLPCDETLADYAKYLGSFDTDYYTCHCTGTEQYEFMKKHMDRLSYLACGQSIII